jgi:pimeloyl-ACP methyl ester carboxylesterase
MTNFVLVPGAWLGAWAWDEVAGVLRAEGHAVFPVTLSGLAERHGPDTADISQQQHVDDIVSVIEKNDLYDVVLAGHSYSGIPVGQAAARIGDRLRRVVYVDSNIPTDGKSFLDGWSDEGRAWVQGQMEESGGFWPPLTVEDYAGQDLSDEAIATILRRGTPHPGRAISEPAHLVRPIGELPTTYIKCLMDGAHPSADVAEQLESPSWDLVELPTGHWPMFSQPPELAKIFAGLVERLNAGDVDGVVALYEPHAVLALPDGSVAEGAEAIQAFYAELLAARPVFAPGKQSPALVAGDLALTSSRLGPDRATAEVARRQPDGTWRWLLDRPNVLG